MATRPIRLASPPESLDDDPLVTEVMTIRLVGIVPTAPLSTALHLMASTGVRHLPVIDGQRCPGLVREADVVRCLAQAPGPFGDASPLLVGDICRPTDPLTVGMRRSDAAQRMEETGSDAVLVADNGRLVGIITATDLIHSLAGRAAPQPAEPEGCRKAYGRPAARGPTPLPTPVPASHAGRTASAPPERGSRR